MNGILHASASAWPRRRLLGALGAAALAPGLGLLAGCSKQAAPAPDRPAVADTPEHQAVLARLYDQAKAAGEHQVVVYTAFAGAAPLWDVFNRRFPGVQVVPTQAAALPAQFREPGDKYQLPWQNVFTVAYNTGLAAPARLPDSLDDLLDPAWRGRIVMPRLAGTSVPDVVLATLVHSGKLDEKALRVLRDQSRQLDMGELVSSVAQGRIPFSIWTPAQSIALLADSGAPVRSAFPPDLAVLFGPGVGLLEHAPHPHAARLFKAWLFGAHGQHAIAKQLYSYGTMPGAPIPDGFPGRDSYRQKDLPLADANRMLAEFRQLTLSIWGGR